MAEITFETFSRKLVAAGKQVEKREAKIVLEGSTALAREVAQAYRGVTGGDGLLSGTQGVAKGRLKAARVSARAKDVRRYSDGTYSGLVVPSGPWALIERDVKPHVILPGYTAKEVRLALKRARRAAYKEDLSARQATIAARLRLSSLAARALDLPWGPRAWANHPGTRGRPTFSNGVATAGPKVGKKMLAEVTKQLAEGYRVGR